MASMARWASSATSALVDVDRPEHLVGGRPAQPGDVDVAELPDLVQLDEPGLEQLEDREEADDDLDPLDQRAGERSEGRAAEAGQLVDQLLDGVGHVGRDGGDVEEVDVGLGAGQDLDRKSVV